MWLRRWENILSDRNQLFSDLLRYVEGGDANRPISIFIEGACWDFEAQDLKCILLTALFEAPSLRKEVETLQEQIAGETLSFEPHKWEYTSIIWGEKESRILGENGWELVSVVKESLSRSDVAYFKRPK
jgi:hypothetical protein